MSYQDDNLKSSLVISTCLHVGALLTLYFGLPSIFKPLPPPPTRIIPFDIVEIGALTNTRLPNSVEGDIKQGEKLASAKEEEPKAEEKPPEPKPAPPPPAPEPKPVVPPTPTPPDPKPPEEAPDEAALPKPQSKPVPPAPPKPTPPPQQDQLASILKNLAKMKTPPAKQSDEMKPSKASPAKADGNRAEGGKSNGISQDNGTSGGGYGASLSDRLTISQEDALRRQIALCWNIPSGARNARDLAVEVVIEMNPDRTVRDAKVVDQMRMSMDPYFRSAAESALRALRSPKCSPLELPADMYEQWKVIRFVFDPRDVL